MSICTILACFGECRHLARHAVVEADADSDQQVAIAHGPIRVDAAVHAQHVQRQRIGQLGNVPSPIKVMVTGILVSPHQLRQLGAGSAER